MNVGRDPMWRGIVYFARVGGSEGGRERGRKKG